MSIFKINTTESKIQELNILRFKSEGNHKISPQNLLASYPEIILSIPELEISNTNAPIVIREFSTPRGPIDIVLITENGDIILIETKLFRNPESHRTVVAQAIDYTKAFSEIDIDSLRSQNIKSKYSNQTESEQIFNDSFLISVLRKNISTGNFKVIIAGDKIHPNILGMVDSIQSAPHLAFTVYMVELNPFQLDNENIILNPQIVANTVEVERSVIRLEIDYKEKTHTIESTVPEKEGKGSRPILTRDEFLETVESNEIKNIIVEFWKKWEKISGDIRFGVAGFSAGILYNNKRIAIFTAFYDYLNLLSEKSRLIHNIDDKSFQVYKNHLKNYAPTAYDFQISNRVQIGYEKLSTNDIREVMNAILELGKELKKS